MQGFENNNFCNYKKYSFFLFVCGGGGGGGEVHCVIFGQEDSALLPPKVPVYACAFQYKEIF